MCLCNLSIFHKSMNMPVYITNTVRKANNCYYIFGGEPDNLAYCIMTRPIQNVTHVENITNRMNLQYKKF